MQRPHTLTLWDQESWSALWDSGGGSKHLCGGAAPSPIALQLQGQEEEWRWGASRPS